MFEYIMIQYDYGYYEADKKDGIDQYAVISGDIVTMLSFKKTSCKTIFMLWSYL